MTNKFSKCAIITLLFFFCCAKCNTSVRRLTNPNRKMFTKRQTIKKSYFSIFWKITITTHLDRAEQQKNCKRFTLMTATKCWVSVEPTLDIHFEPSSKIYNLILSYFIVVLTSDGVNRVTSRNDVVKTRLESRLLPNDSTRVSMIDSRLESDSFSQSLQTSYWQAQVTLHTENGAFLLQWRLINIGANFLLWLCLVVMSSSFFRIRNST